MKKARKSPAKKAATKKIAKRTTKKKVPAKKATAVTATDQVLKVVNRFKKGVDVQTLVKKTGLAPTTVRNVVSRAAKQGKIKRVDKGVYARA